MSISDDPNIPQAPDGVAGVQPLRDRDSSIEPDPAADPAQADWDRTIALDEGADPDADATATGDDPAHLHDDREQIPAEDLPSWSQEPDTQGMTPEVAELGDDGQGDLAPEDL